MHSLYSTAIPTRPSSPPLDTSETYLTSSSLTSAISTTTTGSNTYPSACCYFTYTPHSYPHYTPLESGVLYPPAQLNFEPSKPIARWSSFPSKFEIYDTTSVSLTPKMPSSNASSSSSNSRRQTTSSTSSSTTSQDHHPPSFVSFDSTDSASSSSSASSVTPPVSLEYARCLRCQRGLSIDSSTSTGISPNAVCLGTNLYYCKRCAAIVGYTG